MILVFKTSVRTAAESAKLKEPLNALNKDARWNFDLEDCDNILRVEGAAVHAEEIESLLQREGFDCQELED